MELNTDVLLSISSISIETAIKIGLICKEWRDLVDSATGVVFDFRRQLMSVQSTSLQEDLVEKLALSRICVNLGKHKKKRHKFGFYNIFTHDSAADLFHSHGGIKKFEARVSRRMSCRMKNGK